MTQKMTLIGAGRMGSALAGGWLKAGQAGAIDIVDPHVSDTVQAWADAGQVRLNPDVEAADILVVAVKPQVFGDLAESIAARVGPETLVLSVMAGVSLATLEAKLGTPNVARAMPNTPAAIGRGITALVGNSRVSDDRMALAEALLAAVGQTVQLESEDQMDAVTAVSGSGPAYVFHLIETLAAAGVAEGLSEDLALTLARATVAGAGALAEASDEGPDQLRVNVTSPGGTTAAALGVLMDEGTGFPPLLRRAVKAAADRGRELAG